MSWSAVQIQTFSMFKLLADEVMCMLMKPTMQSLLIAAGGVATVGVIGQSLIWREEPAKPPIRMCTSQRPEGPDGGGGEFGFGPQDGPQR